MAEESQQEVMTFESEEARLEAIDAFDEKTGNVEDLQKIRDAEIKAKEETSDSEEATETEETQETKTEEAAEDKTATQEAETPKEPFTVKPEELPEGIKTPGELAKSWKEAQDLIKRQGERIQKDQERMADLQSSTQRSDVAEAELKGVQKEVGVKPKPAEEDKEIPESNLSKIMALQEEFSKLEDPFDEKAIAINRELIPLQNQEIMRTNMIANKANEEAQSLRKTVTEYQSRQDETSLAERNKVEYEKQLNDMDEFSKIKEYKDEYEMTISVAEADNQYRDWRNGVVKQYYNGVLPNEGTEEGQKAISHAMYMYQQKSPDLLEKMRVVGIPLEPSEDLQRYVKLCKLYDDMECIVYDPVLKQRVRLDRYNPKTGKREYISFPSLKATIENKRVEGGYYKQRELDANKNGAKSMADAITKRDTKELENDTGSAAETQLSTEQAYKVMDDFNMEKAYKEYYQKGDPSVFNEFNAARRKMGQPPIDLTNVATLKKA